MTDLAEFLFPVPARRNVASILRWWEQRRVSYNVIVGGAGILSMGAASLLAALPPDSHPPGIPIAPVVVFGVLANVCYFLGPAIEIAIERLSKGRILATGPALFRMGLTFSVGMAFLPTLVMGFDWAYRIIRAIL